MKADRRHASVLSRALRCGPLALSLGLAACAVGPDYAAPGMTLPRTWANVAGTKAQQRPAAPPARWWTKLGDRKLDQIVAMAVEGNLDVAAAKARIREARANRRQVIGGLFPQVDGAASASRSRGSTTEGGANVTANAFRAGLDASWELDLFGSTYRGVEAATYGVDAADDDLRAVLLTLVGDVATTYVEARGFQARAALARRTAVSQRETEALTRTRFQAGAASAVDTSQAAGQASATEAQVPALEAAFAQSVHQLGVLTGRPPAALVPLLGRGPIPTAASAPRPGIPADVLRSRPDVSRAERQLAQATARIGQAEAALYPSISLTGNLSTAGLKLGDLAKNTAIGWTVGPTLSVPIFNGGELRAAVEVAQAQRDQYDAAFRLSVLTAMQDVENALVQLAQERIRGGKLAASASAYREATRLSRTLYQGGTASFLDVLDSERSLYSAEDSLLQHRVSLATNFIALNKALGGGWDRPVDVSRPAVADANTGPHLRSSPRGALQ